MSVSKFGSAFASARKAGKKTFEYAGKSYTTETKNEKKAGVPRPRSDRPASKPTKAPVAGLKKVVPGRNKNTPNMKGRGNDGKKIKQDMSSGGVGLKVKKTLRAKLSK